MLAAPRRETEHINNATYVLCLHADVRSAYCTNDRRVAVRCRHVDKARIPPEQLPRSKCYEDVADFTRKSGVSGVSTSMLRGNCYRGF